MSLAISKAIVARVRGTETLTGDAAEAQQILVSLFGDPPKIKRGMLASKVDLPCITFRTDAGVDALEGVDIGEMRHTIIRFFVWTVSRDGDFLPTAADALERLFNQRRGAPDIALEGDGRIFWSDLFVDLQEPLEDQSTNNFYGMISFRFVENRP